MIARSRQTTSTRYPARVKQGSDAQSAKKDMSGNQAEMTGREILTAATNISASLGSAEWLEWRTCCHQDL